MACKGSEALPGRRDRTGDRVAGWTVLGCRRGLRCTSELGDRRAPSCWPSCLHPRRPTRPPPLRSPSRVCLPSPSCGRRNAKDPRKSSPWIVRSWRSRVTLAWRAWRSATATRYARPTGTCGSVVIVEVAEADVAGVAFGFGGPGPDVGPLLEQDAVVALDLAVGLRASRPGFLDGGAGLRAGPVPEPGAVAGAIVGDDPLAADAEGGEPGGGAGPEAGAVAAVSSGWISP
jgi:hypothetical protein